jgi:ABC-type transporter Mla subunit MlaD
MAMTQAEANAQLQKTNETLVKIGNETDKLIQLSKQLKEQLDAAGGAGGTITPELEQTINAIDQRANAIDQLVPDSPGPESAKK